MSSHSPLPGRRFILYDDDHFRLIKSENDPNDIHFITHQCSEWQTEGQVIWSGPGWFCRHCDYRPPEEMIMAYNLIHEEPNRLIFAEDWYCGGFTSQLR